MNNKSTLGLYTLSIASEILGIPKKTLLNYENSNITDVKRTESGRRLYSQSDLLKILIIKELLLIGIKMKALPQIFELREKVLKKTKFDIFNELLGKSKLNQLEKKLEL